MNDILPHMTIYNLMYASFFLVTALFFSYILNRYISISPMGKHNDLSLEGLRGLACILVFINHSYHAVSAIGIKSPVFNIEPASAYGKMGSFGVAIFFCLTGFLFSSAIKSGKIDILFFKKRIYRLLPAYLFVATLVLFIFIIQKYARITSFNDVLIILQRVYGFGFWGSGIKLGNTLDGGLNVVIWTLPYEWKFYAAIPFLACAYAIKPLKIALIPFALIVMYLGYQSDTILWTYFITGFIASFVSKTENRIMKLISYILLIIFFTYAVYGDFKAYSFEMYIYISLFFITYLYCRPSLLEYKIISSIGIISYSLYLLHQPVMNLTFRAISYFVDLKSISTKEFMSIQALSIVIAILTSMFLYNKIEKKFRIK
ncbi:acyltransferase family protein [Proteus terrae]|uniref:acyltransferase family protein n=1 Tax=Proteus terrae TaxID=1574161 RepID=UPI00288B47FE|nr:acyltransferase [Proteus terrae]